MDGKIVEGTVTISLADYEGVKRTVKELRDENKRLNSIVNSREVQNVLHKDSK